jgi:GWxTD domain-containing protein
MKTKKKMSRALKSSLLLLLFIAGLASCKRNAIVPTGSYQYLYDFESRDIHPEYVVYHHRDDSSTVHFRVFSNELLYTRQATNSPFVLNLIIKATISDMNGMAQDTISVALHEAAKDRQGWLLGSMRVPMKTGQWNLLMEFTDVARNLTQPSFITCDKLSSFSAQNYLLTKFETGEPVFGGFVSPGQMVEVYSARNTLSELPALFKLNSEIKLPPPPFSSNAPEYPDFSGAQPVALKVESEGSWVFEVVGGLYFLTHDSAKRIGFTIKTSNTHFPRVKEVSSLEWPIRFITTKSEHEEIIKNNYPKLLIDRFWLECGGSKEHARELIRIFYRRVEEANYYFSTYTEGWRTDRGMIHLLFGNPNQVIRSSQGEVWNYGEDNQAALLSFTFKKVDSPFTNNLYVLEREPGYKPYWERMVQTWRSGKIYSE